MKTKICILIIVLLFNGCKDNTGDKEMLTREQIIEIANQVVKDEGMSFDLFIVAFDTDNKRWEETYALLKQEMPDVAREYSMLKKYSYQSVHYIPDPNKKTGTLGQVFVFIDKHTGELITFCAGI